MRRSAGQCDPGRDALAVVSTKTGADMGHDPKVTRLYSLRKPAPNVAAFGRAGEGHSGALALIFNDIPRMSHQGKVLAAHVCFGSEADIRAPKDFVRLVPCVDGSWLASRNFTSHRWSVQPCVRPVSAVRMTAGHNALRGSGPGQKPAFCDALAHVGCPDRRIDRLCITCCSPSQPSHRAGCPARSRSRRKGDGFLVALALGHQGPSHSGNLVGECDGDALGRPPR